MGGPQKLRTMKEAYELSPCPGRTCLPSGKIGSDGDGGGEGASRGCCGVQTIHGRNACESVVVFGVVKPNEENRKVPRADGHG